MGNELPEERGRAEYVTTDSQVPDDFGFCDICGINGAACGACPARHIIERMCARRVQVLPSPQLAVSALVCYCHACALCHQLSVWWFAAVMPSCCAMTVLWPLIPSCPCLDLLPLNCHFGCSAPVHFSWALGGSQRAAQLPFNFSACSAVKTCLRKTSAVAASARTVRRSRRSRTMVERTVSKLRARTQTKVVREEMALRSCARADSL